MSKEFEIEVRGPLTEGQYHTISKRLEIEGEFVTKKDRVLIDYSTFLAGEELEGRKKDIRLRVTNKKPEIIVKLGGWGGNEQREELSVLTHEGSFDTLVKIFNAMGYSKGMLCVRNSKVYNYKGVEFALVEIPFGITTFRHPPSGMTRRAIWLPARRPARASHAGGSLSAGGKDERRPERRRLPRESVATCSEMKMWKVRSERMELHHRSTSIFIVATLLENLVAQDLVRRFQVRSTQQRSTRCTAPVGRVRGHHVARPPYGSCPLIARIVSLLSSFTFRLYESCGATLTRASPSGNARRRMPGVPPFSQSNRSRVTTHSNAGSYHHSK